MMSHRSARAAAMTVVAIVVAGGVVVSLAGPLTPPAGPVAPTLKTLAEVEPRIAINATNTPGDTDSLFKISQPGSYYLTGNIDGIVGKHGIEIAASGVALDLNGFVLMGAPAMGAFDGVRVIAAGVSNIAVVHGSVRNWGDEGIDLISAGVVNGRVADVLVSSNAGAGLAVGQGFTVSTCSARLNGGIGISTGVACTVTHCSATSNTGGGISTSVGCTVANCAATGNTGGGITAGEGCKVTDCSARGNSSGGIDIGSDCSLIGCTVTLNTSIGIDAGARCTILKTTIGVTIGGPGVRTTFEGLRIEGCSIHGNSTFGVEVDTASDIAELAVVDCTIRDNGSAGISSEASTQVLDSVVSGNGGAGILLAGTCLVRGCTITSNTASGVELTGHANVVQNNTVSANAPLLAAAAGILVLGTDNTIDGNRLFSNTQGGIKVNSGGNLVLRNYLARAGATIAAVAGNSVAQIIASPAAGFISTDPNANFTY